MHHHRRRKKRPNYGTRTVDVSRGLHGFGFTISGQQPCILSCIVTNSPADLAGLRAGDFLISVNALNVSRLPHESVVQLIGNSSGTIRMQIAENYYSDSSDEDNYTNNQLHAQHHRVRYKYSAGVNQKVKLNRLQQQHPGRCFQTTPGGAKKHHNGSSMGSIEALQMPIEENPPTTAHNIIHSPSANNARDISNVSAMVWKVDEDPRSVVMQTQSALEYRVIVGYLGTIEMPKQIATSSKLQTVRSCIRKMRQEKRHPVIVLMTILPGCLSLKNCSHTIIAEFPTQRLTYVSSSSENENRFFGLVTSAIFVDGVACDVNDVMPPTNDIIISSSCHVFAVDSKLIDHAVHLQHSDEFRIECTRDPITSLCLEFPCSSEYVVSLIRSMYTIKFGPIDDQSRFHNLDPMRMINIERNANILDEIHDENIPNSPQPSNHSENTTTSSNSDSGIGFHNECTTISDSILVVDFPGIRQLPMGRTLTPSKGLQNGNQIQSTPNNRRCTIVNDILETDYWRTENHSNSGAESGSKTCSPLQLHFKSKSIDLTKLASCSNSAECHRLTVRAMPNPKLLKYYADKKHQSSMDPNPEQRNDSFTFVECDNLLQEHVIDVECNTGDECKDSFIASSMHRSCMPTSRSYDDMVATMNGGNGIQLLFGDIQLLSNKLTACPGTARDHVFLLPKPPKKAKKLLFCKTSRSTDDLSTNADYNEAADDKMLSYKLCPKVFGVPRPVYMSIESSILPEQEANEVFTNNNIDNDDDDNDLDKSGTAGIRVDDVSIGGSLRDLRNLTSIADNLGHSILSDNGAYSEPNLRFNSANAIAPAATTPFCRWGNTRSRSNELRTSPLRRSPSLAASESDVYTKSHKNDMNSLQSHKIYSKASSVCSTGAAGTNQSRPSSRDSCSVGVASWCNSFERLLEDAAGLHTFSEFLKKEFSAENICFWTACERYRQLSNEYRSQEAEKIFAKHLAVGAPEPVNVDSPARQTAQENLEKANTDLFLQAQKQIFNLMKFDSYQRFIRSPLYKKCLEAEAQNIPLPYPADQLDVGLRIESHSASTSKLKKSLSNAEDRRRKSLLPWHRKARCKSRDRSESADKLKQTSMCYSLQQKPGVMVATSNSDIHSSRSSLSSFDAAVYARAVANDSEESKNVLCRVILSDGATTVVQTRSNESVRELIERLLEKRGITYCAYDVSIVGNSKPIDLEQDSSCLAGKEVHVEQRVVFKIDLPNKKVISVKSKACKEVGEVLRPILHKYNFQLDFMQITCRNTSKPVDMAEPVTNVDGYRLQMLLAPNDEWQSGIQPMVSVPPEEEAAKVIDVVHSSQLQHSFHKNDKATNNSSTKHLKTNQNTLDEITNKVFNELLQGKADSHSSPNGIELPVITLDLKSTLSEDYGSEASSGIFGRLRKRENNLHFSRKVCKKSEYPVFLKPSIMSDEETANSSKRPLIAKWKSGVKMHNTRSENHDLLEGLKRAQRSRLEDQRGTEINFELPDFLKDKENKPKQSDDPVLPSTMITRPQPAPRLSIIGTRPVIANAEADTLVDAEDTSINRNTNATRSLASTAASSSNNVTDNDFSSQREPPPLPPKPKVIPIRPSNWGQISSNSTNETQQMKRLQSDSKKSIFFDQSSSSIV